MGGKWTYLTYQGYVGMAGQGSAWIRDEKFFGRVAIIYSIAAKQLLTFGVDHAFAERWK